MLIGVPFCIILFYICNIICIFNEKKHTHTRQESYGCRRVTALLAKNQMMHRKEILFQKNISYTFRGLVCKLTGIEVHLSPCDFLSNCSQFYHLLRDAKKRMIPSGYYPLFQFVTIRPNTTVYLFIWNKTQYVLRTMFSTLMKYVEHVLNI